MFTFLTGQLLDIIDIIFYVLLFIILYSTIDLSDYARLLIDYIITIMEYCGLLKDKSSISMIHSEALVALLSSMFTYIISIFIYRLIKYLVLIIFSSIMINLF